MFPTFFAGNNFVGATHPVQEMMKATYSMPVRHQVRPVHMPR